VSGGTVGDHPLTDLFIHGESCFNPEIDRLLYEIRGLAGAGSAEWRRLEEEIDWFVLPPLDQLERELVARRDRLRQEAVERGWEPR
jgi:hypothetical protein